jgi:hypothetical protein
MTAAESARLFREAAPVAGEGLGQLALSLGQGARPNTLMWFTTSATPRPPPEPRPSPLLRSHYPSLMVIVSVIIRGSAEAHGLKAGDEVTAVIKSTDLLIAKG